MTMRFSGSAMIVISVVIFLQMNRLFTGVGGLLLQDAACLHKISKVLKEDHFFLTISSRVYCRGDRIV